MVRRNYVLIGEDLYAPGQCAKKIINENEKDDGTVSEYDDINNLI